MADVTVVNGAGKMAARLERFGAVGVQEIQKVIASTTALAQGEIQDKITSGIRAHSGLSRKQNPQEVVTDLVDTGAYRQSWQIHVGPGKGTLYTNSVQALYLEYGDEHLKPGFAVARETARKMRGVYVQAMQKKLQELLSR